MGGILYGYKIEMGKARIDPDAADRIAAFIRHYMSGLSIREAGESAHLPLSQATMIKLIKNEAYLGTDYYPALISAEVFSALQEEHEKRTHPGTVSPARPVPVKTKFLLSFPPEETEYRTAAETAELIYSMIVPSENGQTKAAGYSLSALRRWVSEKEREREERSPAWQ